MDDVCEDPVAAWARSGAMALTGRHDGPPLVAPAGCVERCRAVEAALTRHSAALGATVVADSLTLLGERAAVAQLGRGGDWSCGRSSRLLPAGGGGWLAVTLARHEDRELVPAWLETAPSAGDDVWETVAAGVARRDASELADRAQLLGMPVAALPPVPPEPFGVNSHGPHAGLPVIATCTAPDPAPPAALAGLLVADLSALWAGPLCTHLLQQAGLRVVKVESLSRPDGARRGPPAFFDLLHGGQESVALYLSTPRGRTDLRTLLDGADVVVEASRPRALEQLGVDASDVLSRGRPRVWLSITGYGRTGPGRNLVAFGDDAAAAGGLVVWDHAGPCFCADAIADPAAGLVAAAAVFASLAAGGRWLLDVSLRGVAAHLAGGTGGTAEPAFAAQADGTVATSEGTVRVAPPRARLPRSQAPALGRDTDTVLAELRRHRS